MSENSESLIIVSENTFELETPAVSPFYPKSLKDVFHDLVDTNYFPYYDRKSTEAIVFEMTCIQALGEVLIQNSERYFKETHNKTNLKPLTTDLLFDTDKLKDLDGKMETLYHGLGVSEKTYIESLQSVLSDLFESEKKPNLRYAFTVAAGADYINVMTRLFVDDKASVYQQFMQDALTHKIAGYVLRDAAVFHKEGILLPLTDQDLTWNNLVRRAAGPIDARYLGFKI